MMVKPARLVCAISLVALLGACSLPSAKWETFTNEPGNFGVSVPGTLQESATITDLEVGQVESHLYTLNHAEYIYSVGYVDYPIPGVTRANPFGQLDGQVRRILEARNAALVSQKDIMLDDAPGIEFRAKLRKGDESATLGMVYGRVYLLDARLYELVVIAGNDRVAAANAHRFLAPFEWIKTDRVQ